MVCSLFPSLWGWVQEGSTAFTYHWNKLPHHNLTLFKSASNQHLTQRIKDRTLEGKKVADNNFETSKNQEWKTSGQEDKPNKRIEGYNLDLISYCSNNVVQNFKISSIMEGQNPGWSNAPDLCLLPGLSLFISISHWGVLNSLFSSSSLPFFLWASYKSSHTNTPTLPFLWLINQRQIIRKVTPLMITAFL